jgi:curved DNA-binding protein CbpA
MPRSASQQRSAPAAAAAFAGESHPRVCEHPGCMEAGLHRAPRARNRPGEYIWFCLEHVRAYNQSWDWFSGMSADEIYDQRRRDQTWDRPTWAFTGPGSRHFHDPFDLFEEEREETRHRREARRARARTEEDRALAELDLTAPATLDDVKTRYKFLVKRLHPDANGGDIQAEERLKTVNRAYSTLKRLYAASTA